MANTDNPHVRRLQESLTAHCGAHTAEEAALSAPLSKTPNEKQKARWVDGVLAELNARFDEDTVRRIRMDCACGPSPAQANKMRALYQRASSLEAFAALSNKHNPAFTMWCEGGTLFFSYPACYCSMVKHRDIHSPKTWCYCTLGYAKRLFEHVLGRSVEVELLESIKQGHTRCVMSVR